MKKNILIAAFALIFIGGVQVTRSHAATFDLKGWAWSSNIGWLSFSSTNNGSGVDNLFGPVVHYTFDDNTADDVSGNDLDATLLNGPTFVTGIVGAKAVSLDGVNDRISLPAPSALTSLTSVTLSLWIKPNVIGTQWRFFGYNLRYVLELMDGANSGKLRCAFTTVNNTYGSCGIISTTALQANTWYHVALTYDGVSRYTYYINGVAAGTSNSPFNGALSGGQNTPCIGHNICTSTTGGFNGSIDDVRIYSRALTAAEIQQIYTVSITPPVSYGVTAATSTGQTAVASLSGYAWSPNIGWLSFNPSSVSGCPSSESANDSPGQGAPISTTNNLAVPPNCAPRVDLSSGKVSGWARILSMAAEDSTTGWLHLSGTNHQSGSGGVTYNPTSGAFSGYAWEPSSVGWVDFTVNSLVPGSGVVICSPGPGCPPRVSQPITCAIGTITTSNGDVFIPVTLSSGGTWYRLNRDGVEVDRTRFSDTIVDDDLGLIPGTYTYQIVRSSDGLACGNPVIYSVASTPANSGLRLMIASPSKTLSDTDYDDSVTSDKSLRVVKGSQFKLKWNINPALATAGYNRFSAVITPANGAPVASWGGLASGQQTFSTSNALTGRYRFTLTVYDAAGALEVKVSSVDLQIVSSSVEEI